MTNRRSTVQRKIILEELRKSGGHMTAAELYRVVRLRIPRVSLGTVYRNLELLDQGGLVRKMPTAGRENRFDGIIEPHYHLHCQRCGRIENVHGSVSVRLEGDVANATGWHLAGPQIEFAGVCPDCLEDTSLSQIPEPVGQ